MSRLTPSSLARHIVDLGAGGKVPVEARRIRTVNLITAGGFFFNTAYTILYAVVDFSALRGLIAANVVWDLAYVFVFRLNARGRNSVAVWLLVIVGWVNMVSASAVLGRDSGLYLFLLLVPTLAALVGAPDDRVIVPVGLGVGTMLFVITGLVFDAGSSPLEGTTLMTGLFIGAMAGSSLMIGLIAVYNRSLVDRAETALAEAKEQSDRLLLNILPEAIAERLKAGESPIADRVDDVSVLFADLVDSTPLAERLDADELVALLDRVFSEFDDLADRFGLEKINTIGDGYVAVAGAPIATPDHAAAAAEMALAMKEALAGFTIESYGALRMRFGLHSGPVVAGVIGKRKFRYDLWGDTVNTASRMESHGEPGRIQVSEDFRRALGERYEYMARGAIEVKGKGSMQTYFLLGRVGG